MLKLQNIVKTYDLGDLQVKALKGVSIEFRKNEFVSILGPSGCGKTTLLNIVGGLDKYTSGDLVINGVSTKDFTDRDWDTYRNHSIGFVFQSYNLIPHQTVLKNVEISLTLSGISKEERKRRAIEALEKVGLKDQIHKKPNQMSGGQMQRVAIARAIVNNPDIILADEPTGALDTETSVQVMDILKELSKETLVIMVTHNPEIAEKYSTRTVKLLDGEIISDSNPYTAPKEEVKKETEPKSKKKYTAMSVLTAFLLSLNNLFTKKARTFLTAFAGSIGIIGITLVMALSNGFQKYIDKVQADTLSSYPLIVSASSVNYESLLNYTPDSLEQYPVAEKIFINEVSELLGSLVSENNINESYVSDVIEQIPSHLTNAISYSYAMTIPIYKNYIDSTTGTEIAANINNTTNSIMGIGMGLFAELLDNESFVRSQYDVIYGKYPENYNEVVLVVDKYNQITDIVIQSLGIDSSIITVEDDGSKTIDFEKIIGTEFKIIPNDVLYSPVKNDNGDTLYFKSNKMDLNLDYDLVEKDVYENEKNISIKVAGIIRLNSDSTTGQMGQVSTIGFLPELTDKVFEVNGDSDIVNWQKENPTLDPFKGIAYNKNEQESQYKNNMARLGGTKIPNSISIYPKDFESKELIKTFLEEKNAILNEIAQDGYYLELGKEKSIDMNIYPDSSLDGEELDRFYIDLGRKYSIPIEKEEARLIGKKAEVTYTDIMAILVSAISGVIDAISYVLIAFTAISLVVSSIMIGIITYVSVIERTKEIGILRAVGARKKDISRVFNAETFIIGLSSGVFGVTVTYILSIPINIILEHLIGLTSIAKLDPMDAIVVIIISFTLTLISGLIPSRIAAKKDPVTALRSE